MRILPSNNKMIIQIFNLLIAVFLVFKTSAQIDQFDINTDSLSIEVTDYNNNKEEIEQLIRAKECVVEKEQLASRLLKELEFADSVVSTGNQLALPTLAKSNKLLIVGDFFEGDKCIFMMYPKVKFLAGCEEPFITPAIDWKLYPNLDQASKEGTVCIEAIQSSGFTQVEKIPGVELTQKSADMLLAKIERVLVAYEAEIGITFEQYENFEKKKSLTNLNDIILLRTAFINKCRTRIK